MLRIVIVDDDAASVATTEEFVERYARTHGIAYHLECFENGFKLVDNYKAGYDVIFLDIQMPGIDGISVAQEIRRTDSEVSIVFVTNMAQCAIKGYEVDASDFIVKPISYGDFAFKLDRILLKRGGTATDARVQVRDGDAVKIITLKEVRYVEVIKHRLIYHTVTGDYETRGVLKKEEPILIGHGFAKCNNYCFVNLWYVSGFLNNTLFVSSGKHSDNYDEIQMSRSKKKSFLLTLNTYIGDNI